MRKQVGGPCPLAGVDHSASIKRGGCRLGDDLSQAGQADPHNAHASLPAGIQLPTQSWQADRIALGSRLLTMYQGCPIPFPIPESWALSHGPTAGPTTPARGENDSHAG